MSRKPPAPRCSRPAATRSLATGASPRSPWRRRWKRWPRSRKRSPPASGCIVTVAEGIPLHDALKIGRAVRYAGATWIGGSTPGMAMPGEIKLGFLPDVCLRPGPFAIMSKSGTLSYERGYRLGRLASARAYGSASAATR